ncbi:HET domain containing protein, partial [Rhypophila decipiens]
MPAMTQSFEYDSRELSGSEFRLLRIPKAKEGGADSLLCCELFLASLTADNNTQPSVPYHALSYVWGSDSKRRYIEVNGRSFQVTVNLYEALSCLQSPNHERIIWVDAVCINQQNPWEQGHQVRQMGQIYKTAGLVIYWLGVQTNTRFCLDALRAFQERVRDVTYEGWTRQQWRDLWQSWAVKREQSYPSLEREGLRTLLHRPWFRRVWILQEVANSQSAEVLCGELSVWAGIFALAPLLMGVQAEAHTQSVLDMMPGPLRRDSWFSKSRDLYTLLEKFGSSEATDPRDLVYALLGLSSDASPHIQPDYEKNEQEVVHTVFPFLYHIDLNLPTKFSGPATLQDLCKRVSFFNEVALEVAATNEISGDCITEFILSRSPRVNVRESTESLVETAASNESNGDRILEYLLRQQGQSSVTEKALVTAARNRAKGRGLIQICFSFCGDQILPMLTQRLVEAAADNDICGNDIISDIVNRGGGPYRITDQIIRIAASNPVRGVTLLNTL